MRRIVSIFSLLLLLTNKSFCQTEQQNFIAGGGFDMTFSQQDSNRIFTMNIAPSFGYFVAKNLMLGFALGIGITSDNRARGGENRFFLNTLFVPTVRYYFLKGKLKPFLYGKFGYISTTAIIRGNTGNVDGITGGGGIGFDYFVTKNLAVECTFGYNGSKLSNRSLNSQTGISFGLQYFFTKPKKELNDIK